MTSGPAHHCDLFKDIFAEGADAIEHVPIVILEIEKMVNEGARPRACTRIRDCLNPSRFHRA